MYLVEDSRVTYSQLFLYYTMWKSDFDGSRSQDDLVIIRIIDLADNVVSGERECREVESECVVEVVVTETHSTGSLYQTPLSLSPDDWELLIAGSTRED